MILAVDVSYREHDAVAAGVLFRQWEDSKPVEELVVPISTVAEYEPGQFWKRELPCVLALLHQLEHIPETIVIDGHVYLDRDKRPGFGARLYDALQGKSAIIGVAKSKYKDTPPEAELIRRGSKRPLYVTAAGVGEADARDYILRMHGTHRLPTLLRRVDQLSRSQTNT